MCRNIDPTLKSYLYPKQALLGDSNLPIHPGTSVCFAIAPKRVVCFCMWLDTGAETPYRYCIPFYDLESVSITNPSESCAEPCLLFRLTPKVMNKIVKLCGSKLHDPLGDAKRRNMSRYLTIVLGTDPEVVTNEVHLRIYARNDKFTFSWKTARNILLRDLKLLWRKVDDEINDARTKTGAQETRERVSDMPDDAWKWFMNFTGMRWIPCTDGGYILARLVEPEPIEAPSLLADGPVTPQTECSSSSGSPNRHYH